MVDEMSDAVNVVGVCNERYQQVYDGYETAAGRQVVFSHFGEFSQELVNSITLDLENLMLEAGDKKGAIKRVFNILVEALQNIRIHGEKDADGNHGSFVVISRGEEDYLITTGNLATNEAAEMISGRVVNLNKFDAVELKQHYMEVLTNGVMSKKGGAGLGLITMAMKSKNKLGHDVRPVDDSFACLTIESKVDRW